MVEGLGSGEQGTGGVVRKHGADNRRGTWGEGNAELGYRAALVRNRQRPVTATYGLASVCRVEGIIEALNETSFRPAARRHSPA